MLVTGQPVVYAIKDNVLTEALNKLTAKRMSQSLKIGEEVIIPLGTICNDKPNANGRIYPWTSFDDAVADGIHNQMLQRRINPHAKED